VRFVDGGTWRARFSGDGFDVGFAAADPEATIAGAADAVVDLTCFRIMDWLRRAILDAAEPGWLKA
jgi:hypothetical protein